MANRHPWKPDDVRYKNKGRLCDVPGCGKPFYAKGLCHNHHSYLLRNGFLACRVTFYGNCYVSDCNNEAIGTHGLCQFHYVRKQHGVRLDRPKGINGHMNPRWNGGTSQYPNHYEMKKIRKRVLDEEMYVCFYCGKPASKIHHIDESKHNHQRSNLHAICSSCNVLISKKPRKVHTSKYRRAYGKTLNEIARHLNIDTAKVVAMHRNDTLRVALATDEVSSVLF